ncbi:MAG: MBL fold metallo-hydrolase, partial [Proteobacteria bacterium]|nr:MBL fold metallo-hydrolase [Pseudomonadota bacterium]
DIKNIPFLIHEKEKSILDAFPATAGMVGMKSSKKPEVEKYIDPDNVYSFGDCTFRILETPGHSPGSVCFLFDGHVFVGDTLFCGGIGRTDIPGGSYETLIESIKTELFPLDENLVVHTGHGMVTLIGQERASNPFFR